MRTKLLKVERGKPEPLDSIAERRFAALLEEAAEGADAVIFCDFGYGMVSRGLLERALPKLRRRVRILAADVSGPHANLFALPRRGPALPERARDALDPARLRTRPVTGGLEPARSDAGAATCSSPWTSGGWWPFDRRNADPQSPEWSGRLRSEHLPSFAERTVDRLGCGDALLAASTLALAAGADLTAAAYLGNLAAAVEIAHLGNIPVDAAALRRKFRRRPELHWTPEPAPAAETPSAAAAVCP